MQEIKYKDGRVEREFFKSDVTSEEVRAQVSRIARRQMLHAATAQIVAKMDQHLGEVEKKHGRPATVTRRKVGRNDPCPCGSGAKFKKCHLSTAR